VLCLAVSDRSAYILFVRDEMQRVKCADFDGNKNRLRECAQSWSGLSAEEKQHYRDLLNRQQQQYLIDVEEFKKVSTCHVTWFVVAMCVFTS